MQTLNGLTMRIVPRIIMKSGSQIKVNKTKQKIDENTQLLASKKVNINP